MLKLMLIQRAGVTAHKVLDASTRFDDFIELVSYENFDKKITYNRQHKEVQVPHSGTTYTLLEVAGVWA